MFQNVFIVFKNMLQRAIWRSKSGLLKHSVSLPLVISIALLSWHSAISKFCNFGRSNTTSSNNSKISQLLLYLTNLVLFFRAWLTRILDGQVAILVTRQVDLAITRLAFPYYFSLFCSFLHISFLTLFLNPYIWKLRVSH